MTVKRNGWVYPARHTTELNFNIKFMGVKCWIVGDMVFGILDDIFDKGSIEVRKEIFKDLNLK